MRWTTTKYYERGVIIMKRIIQAVGIAALLVTTGCFKYVVKTGAGGDTSRPPAKSVWNHHFVNGMVGESAVDVSSICPSGDATITIERSMVDALLGNVTGNMLWNPSTVEVYCGGAAASLSLDEEEQKKLVKSDVFLDAVAALAPERLDEAIALQQKL